MSSCWLLLPALRCLFRLCSALMQPQRRLSFHRRFVINGQAVPLFPAAETALFVAQLAESCCDAGQLKDAAPLVQLLDYCSAALAADVAAAAPKPVAADAAAAADAVARGAAHAQAAHAASSRSRGAGAAAQQQCGTSSQQREASAGASRHAAARAEADWQQTQPSNPQPCAQQVESAWESAWAASVATALLVRQKHQELVTSPTLQSVRTMAAAD